MVVGVGIGATVVVTASTGLVDVDISASLVSATIGDVTSGAASVSVCGEGGSEDEEPGTTVVVGSDGTGDSTVVPPHPKRNTKAKGIRYLIRTDAESTRWRPKNGEGPGSKPEAFTTKYVLTAN